MAVNDIDLPEVCGLYYIISSIDFLCLQSLAQSEDYDLLAYEAERIVDQVLVQSLLHVRDANDNIADTNQDNHQRGRFIELENEKWQTKTQEESTVKWPTIAEFTDKNVGLEKINEYIEKVQKEDFPSISMFI